MMDQMLRRWFCFPCDCVALPYTHPVRGNWYWKMTSKQAFSSSMWLSASECRESYVPSRKVRLPWRVCFQASIYQELSRCEEVRLQVCSKDLTSRVRAVCFPTLSGAWKHIPMPYRECPWGNRLWQCVWKCWLPSCGYPEEVTFN